MTKTPPIVDRETWQDHISALLIREKAHTREGDAIAAARRRLPMVEVDPATPLVGAVGEVSLIDTFEGRSQMFVSYHMWHVGRPAAGQCEGCTFFTGHALELSYLHSRDVTFAVFCQGPYDQSVRYRDFMGWEMPWYSAPEASSERLLAGRHFGMKVCYLREGDRVFETYWTTGRGVEPMANSYGMLRSADRPVVANSGRARRRTRFSLRRHRRRRSPLGRLWPLFDPDARVYTVVIGRDRWTLKLVPGGRRPVTDRPVHGGGNASTLVMVRGNVRFYPA
jgi:predicted dithiol-disulfide oxidoreductase (DUF899 family)